MQLVHAGAIPVLIGLLNSPDQDVQYYCTTAISNIAVDAANRRKLSQTESRLVQSLIHLMDSPVMKVQCQAALALRNLASDSKYQLDIVRAGGLQPLLRLLQSSYLPLILSSVACIRNISIHPANESPIIDAGFLRPLIDLLAFDENEEIQCHAISTLRNLAASSEHNKRAIVDAGAVDRIRDLVLVLPTSVQSEMTAAVAVLALCDELKPRLLELGICSVLIPLTSSDSFEVQGNSAAALGNLSSKVEDYSAFLSVWDEPSGGLHGYLTRFLQSSDSTFQHIAVWTVVQFIEGNEERLLRHIQDSSTILPAIKQLASSAENITPTASISSTTGTIEIQKGNRDDESGDENEITALARKVLASFATKS
jgi:vacuolar protein 8